MKINLNLLMNGRICNLNLICDNLFTNYYLRKQLREKGVRGQKLMLLNKIWEGQIETQPST